MEYGIYWKIHRGGGYWPMSIGKKNEKGKKKKKKRESKKR
jgi:hypothetical protein